MSFWIESEKRQITFLAERLAMMRLWCLYMYQKQKDIHSMKNMDKFESYKVRITKFKVKVMFYIFLDIREVILCHIVPRGQALDGSYHDITKDMI